MSDVMNAINKMHTKAVNDLKSCNPNKKTKIVNTLATTSYEKFIVPHLVEGVRIKLNTDESYYQTVSQYDLASEEIHTDEVTLHHKRARYGEVIGEPSLPADGEYHGCITVPITLDGNVIPTVIDINGIALVHPRKIVA